MTAPRPPFALLAGGFALALLGVALTLPLPLLGAVCFALGTLVVLAAEAWLVREPRLRRSLEAAHAGGTLRAGLYGVLLTGLAVELLPAHGDSAVRAVAGAAVGIWGLHLAACVLTSDAAERRRATGAVSWRNLAVPGVVRTPRTPLAARDGLERIFQLALAVLGLGTAATVAGASTRVAWMAGAVAVLLALGEVVVAFAEWLKAGRETDVETSVERLADALRELAPEVVFYYSRPEPVGYIANVWMPILEQLDRRVVVVCREPHNAALVETGSIPVVVLSRANDLERVIPESVRLAMYPSNVAKNNHLIRMPGIVDVFVGHGDSDKGGSATTLSRIFDEVWVAGPAARERYHEARVGVRDDQIREIGRPQLAEVARVARRTEGVAVTAADRAAYDQADDTAPPEEATEPRTTVLYAPTREGFFSSWQYSSILSQGRGILTTLLADPGVRVLFKPHPGTGTDDPAFGREVAALTALVEQAGAPHEVVAGTEGLYAAFNRADVLVSDISSVITDFLASGKPYVVTSSGRDDHEAFRAEFPSSGGAWILGGDGTGVGEAVADAMTTDRYAAARDRTAAALLGPQEGDPVARFDAAIDDAVAATERKAAAGEAAAER